MKTIKLTEKLLQKEFDRLNRLYFRNKLKKIPLQIAPSRTALAWIVLDGTKTQNASGIIWHFSNPEAIFFSSLHQFTKKKLVETMCHEMIHQWMAQNNECEYGRNSHGENFAAYCYMLERNTKLKIARR